MALTGSGEGGLIAEGRVSSETLRWQANALLAVLGGIGVYVAYVGFRDGGTARWVVLGLTSIGLVFGRRHYRAAIRHGLWARAYRDRLEFSVGKGPQQVDLRRVKFLYELDGSHVGELFGGERIEVPGGPGFEAVYEFLRGRVPNNLSRY